jgi:hypothetical protein
VGSIIVFYSNRQKAILKIGSSEAYSTHPLLHGLHAEQFALNFITKKLQFNYPLRDIYILIWKQNAVQEIKPAFCCAWCSKMLIKSGFPLRNVITISNEYMDAPSSKIDRMISIQSAICEEKTNTPLMKIKNSRRPMASIYK